VIKPTLRRITVFSLPVDLFFMLVSSLERDVAEKLKLMFVTGSE
jgi:hypothetical protein